MKLRRVIAQKWLASAFAVGGCAQIAGLTGDYSERPDAGGEASGGAAGDGERPGRGASSGVVTNGPSSAGESAAGASETSGAAGIGGNLPIGGAASVDDLGSAGESQGGATSHNAKCGDSAVIGAEGCDDGNEHDGDGCSAACQPEPGFTCSGEPSVCTHRSCVGLAKRCGSTGDLDCCATSKVEGITSATFYRGYDGMTQDHTSRDYPAKVSSFNLDVFEITVSRFKNFVRAYSRDMTPAGAGKNPNNPDDRGWEAAWNAELPEDSDALVAALKCFGGIHQTWTDNSAYEPYEHRPMNCMSWYEAQAFCIWDGGRLATEAEWNYAASGGIEQRVYPWGITGPANDSALAIYDCTYKKTTGCGDDDIAPVGSAPNGNGLYGQADLAGNIAEWVQDSYVEKYPTPCSNCAFTDDTGTKVIRGGFYSAPVDYLNTSFRGGQYPADHNIDIGARCARDLSPP